MIIVIISRAKSKTHIISDYKYEPDGNNNVYPHNPFSDSSLYNNQNNIPPKQPRNTMCAYICVLYRIFFPSVIKN